MSYSLLKMDFKLAFRLLRIGQGKLNDYLRVTFPSSAYSPILFGGRAQTGLPLT